jgi:hypothetical protein
MHSGMYGMYALQENVRQMRGIAPAQIPGAKISVCHGVGGMFAASGTIICQTSRLERAIKPPCPSFSCRSPSAPEKATKQGK